MALSSFISRLLGAANGMENAVSGGEVPYQFAEDDGESRCSKLMYVCLFDTCLNIALSSHY